MLRLVKRHGVETTAGELRELFANRHVHVALIVDGDTLVAVVDRDDVAHTADDVPAVTLGCLTPRTIDARTDLRVAHERLMASGGRRLAVVDPDGTLLGLLCLKRSGAGFCSDANVLARSVGH